MIATRPWVVSASTIPREFREASHNFALLSSTRQRSACWFDQDINRWNVSRVTDMGAMFENVCWFRDEEDIAEFNQPLDAWDVSSVKDMHRM